MFVQRSSRPLLNRGWYKVCHAAAVSTNVTGADWGKNVVFVEGVRSPFLVSGPTSIYKDMMPYELTAETYKDLLKRTGVPKEEIDYAIQAIVINDANSLNTAREALLSSGIPNSVGGHTLTQYCTGGNVAVAEGVKHIRCGYADTVIAGGVDICSVPPIGYTRELKRTLFNISRVKTTAQKLSIAKPLLKLSTWKMDAPAPAEYKTKEVLGHCADRMATSFGVTRQEQDEFAHRSHSLAQKATQEGLLTEVMGIRKPGSSKVYDKDNGIRVAPLEKMAKLKPAFIKNNGTVTAASSSFMSDGASACLLMAEDKAKAIGLKPKAYVRHSAFAAQDVVDHGLMGPAYAIPKILKQAGLTLKDIDVFEIHEAFAAQILTCLKALDCESFCQKYLNLPSKVGEVPFEKLNLYGGSLSVGHPFSATGVRLTSMAANRLQREDGKIALIAACGQGGQGHATILERYS